MSEISDVQNFLELGRRFKSIQSDLRGSVSESWASTFGALGEANELAHSVLVSTINRSANLSILNIGEKEKKQSAIITDFAKSIHAFEYCLSTGLYGAAATLLRREIEAVESIRGLHQSTQLNNKTPRLKALRHFGRSYGQLTGIAHTSDQDAMNYLAGGHPANLDPRFDQSYAAHLLGIHVNCVVSVASQMAHLTPYSVENSKDPSESYYSAVIFGILIEQGVISLKKNE